MARILININPFCQAYFLWYLICLAIGPVFIAAAIYLCLGRTVVIFGENISRIPVGGGIGASAPLTNKPMINLGTHILVAGLSLQVASLFVFCVCCLEFLYRVQFQKAPPNPKYVNHYSSPRFKLFLITLGIATACLFIRTVFRSVELSGCFTGKLANSQVQFMILDGVMVLVVCISLTVMHSGIGFGDQ
ncbi:RTA1 like domain containing protein [Hyaloscypha variabilis]